MNWDGRIRADARQIPLADECVQCVVTSPPYWGLRDYGTARWQGGDPGCDHVERLARNDPDRDERHTDGRNPETQSLIKTGTIQFRDQCGKCGAVRVDSQIGLEKTPQEYVETLVQVFREVWRVLKADGVLWLNLGDSYCSTAPGTMGDKLNQRGILAGVSDRRAEGSRKPRPETPFGLKPKDLVGIPWRVAFALQADGWYLRSDVIWSKKNCMPESVTDRPTRSHEFVFLLSKNERYFYDHEAIKEPGSMESAARLERAHSGYTAPGQTPHKGWAAAPRENKTDKQHGHSRRHAGFNDRWDHMEKTEQCAQPRNKRDVWHIGTTPYPEAHYATFPEEIPETCIRAGSRPGDLVLDPFFGSGTVGRVAERLSRRWVGLDLGYQDLQEKRLRNVQRELVGLGAASNGW